MANDKHRTGQNKNLKEPTLDEILEDVQLRVDRLKIFYEQYFMGLQKLQPLVPRREVQRKMTELAQLNIRNTKHRFMFNMLNQRWQSYTTYWNRTCTQIENGTYYRDVARAKRNAAKRGLDLPAEMQGKKDRAQNVELEAAAAADAQRLFDSSDQGGGLFSGADADIDSMFDNIADTRAASPFVRGASDTIPGRAFLDADTTPRAFVGADTLAGKSPDAGPSDTTPDLLVARRGAMPPGWQDALVRNDQPRPKERHVTRPGVRAAKRAEGTPGMPLPTPQATPAATRAPVDDIKMRAIYDRYVAAKKQVGEPTDKITYESIVRTIQKTAPSLMSQHNAKSVDFDVAIKDNKVILKAIPRK